VSEKDIVERSEMWVIRKGGFFYRPNAQGYTAFLFDAGVWPEEEAKKHNNDDPLGPVEAGPYSDWKDKIIEGSPDDFIAQQDATILSLRGEVERHKQLTADYLGLLQESDARCLELKARAERADAARGQLVEHAQKVLLALNANYAKPSDGDDKWKEGFDEGIKTAATITHALISQALLASLTKEG